MDGYLVEIESKAEDDFIIEKAMSLASNEKDGLDYWIGAQDSDNDGNWTWATSGLYIPIKILVKVVEVSYFYYHNSVQIETGILGPNLTLKNSAVLSISI